MNDNRWKLCSVVIVAPYTVRITYLFFSSLTKKTVLLMQMLGKFSTQQIHTSDLLHLSLFAVYLSICCSYSLAVSLPLIDKIYVLVHMPM